MEWIWIWVKKWVFSFVVFLCTLISTQNVRNHSCAESLTSCTDEFTLRWADTTALHFDFLTLHVVFPFSSHPKWSNRLLYLFCRRLWNKIHNDCVLTPVEQILCVINMFKTCLPVESQFSYVKLQWTYEHTTELFPKLFLQNMMLHSWRRTMCFPHFTFSPLNFVFTGIDICFIWTWCKWRLFQYIYIFCYLLTFSTKIWNFILEFVRLFTKLFFYLLLTQLFWNRQEPKYSLLFYNLILGSCYLRSSMPLSLSAPHGLIHVATSIIDRPPERKVSI